MRPPASKPGSTARRRTNVWTTSAALTSSANDSASCATIEAWRRRRPVGVAALPRHGAGQRRRQIGADAAEHRQHAGEQRHQRGEADGGARASARPAGRRARPARRPGRRPAAPRTRQRRQQQAERAGGRGEQRALDHRLADQPPPRGAERRPHRELVPPPVQPDQLQVGEVDRDEQDDQAERGEQRHQRAADVAGQRPRASA